jgi:hypothetical protein
MPRPRSHQPGASCDRPRGSSLSLPCSAHRQCFVCLCACGGRRCCRGCCAHAAAVGNVARSWVSDGCRVHARPRLVKPGIIDRPMNMWVARFPVMAVAGFAGFLAAPWWPRRRTVLDAHPSRILCGYATLITLAVRAAVAWPGAGPLPRRSARGSSSTRSPDGRLFAKPRPCVQP